MEVYRKYMEMALQILHEMVKSLQKQGKNV